MYVELERNNEREDSAVCAWMDIIMVFFGHDKKKNVSLSLGMRANGNFEK